MKKTLQIKCYGCKKKITEFGALLFSPPKSDVKNSEGFDVTKIHICKTCYDSVCCHLVGLSFFNKIK